MRAADSRTLLSWLYRLEENGSFGMLTLLQRGAEEALHQTSIDAAAYAIANVNDFWNYVSSEQDKQVRRGLSRSFQIVDSTSYIFLWNSLSEGGDAKVRRKQLRLRHRPAFLSMIDGLSHREYEALACVAMKSSGASEVFLTPPGGEGGVDFFALIRTPSKSHLLGGGTNPVRIIGQSKKYASAVQVDKVKEFIETIQEVKHRGEASIERIVPSWFHSVHGPIVGCMIAHAGFQSGATSKARNHGIITADTLDVAEILAAAKDSSEQIFANARTTTCLEEIQKYLQR